jgi:hypothetical protein
VIVLMVSVGEVVMRMGQRLVPMPMRVPRPRRDQLGVLVLMMRVMRVLVFVLQQRMSVNVLVTLGEV